MAIAYPSMLALILFEGFVLLISIAIGGRKAKGDAVDARNKFSARAFYLTVLLAIPPAIYFGRLMLAFGAGAYLLLFLASIGIPILHLFVIRTWKRRDIEY